MGWLSKLISKNKLHKQINFRQSKAELAKGAAEDRVITRSLEQNRQILQEIFDQDEELVFREILIGSKNPVPAAVVFINSLINIELLQRGLMQDLLLVDQIPSAGVTPAWLKQKIASPAEIGLDCRWVDIAEKINRGFVVLFIEGQKQVLATKVMADVHRRISEPLGETVTRGPQDAFNESILNNMALLRKRLPTSRLAVKKFKVGEVTKVELYLVYLKGYVMPGLVEETTQRIDRVKNRLDGITGSGQLEELIQDHPYSVFSGIETSERPDKLTNALLEGRAALIVDNTPQTLILPGPLVSHLQSPEDYYNRFWFASLIRLLRWVSLFAAFLLPSLYIAVLSFHQELIPTTLLVTIVKARELVPFPVFLEALMMEIVFEVLREAGIRLPKPFGQTISIVGAVVIGSAAVSASLASAVLVVVVSLTAIASYTLPSLALNNNVRVLRFPFMILAAFMGLFGIMIGLMMLSFHLCSLRSFGVPYLTPIGPLTLSDLKDTFIRVPSWMKTTRPRLFGYAELQRKDRGLKPKAPPPRGAGNAKKPHPEGRSN